MPDSEKITVPDFFVTSGDGVTGAAVPVVAGGAVVWISAMVAEGTGAGIAGGACVVVQPAVQSSMQRKIPMQRKAVFGCMR